MTQSAATKRKLAEESGNSSQDSNNSGCSTRSNVKDTVSNVNSNHSAERTKVKFIKRRPKVASKIVAKSVEKPAKRKREEEEDINSQNESDLEDVVTAQMEEDGQMTVTDVDVGPEKLLSDGEVSESESEDQLSESTSEDEVENDERDMETDSQNQSFEATEQDLVVNSDNSEDQASSIKERKKKHKKKKKHEKEK